MDTSSTRALTLFAVAVGSLLLFGPLTAVVLALVGLDIASLIGITPPYGWALVVAVLAVTLWAFAVAGEIAMIRVHGVRILHRGDSRLRMAGRHLLLVVPLVAAVMKLTPLVWLLVRDGLTQSNPVYVGITLAFAVAIAWTAIRTLRAFRRGLTIES
ncbi:hypothetical protein [Halocatena halophila]|uniref:hypothetical protein n=1 Tax=Halocatena halophila TaxID=2814576 RepID=UPI002ED06FC5